MLNFRNSAALVAVSITLGAQVSAAQSGRHAGLHAAPVSTTAASPAPLRPTIEVRTIATKSKVASIYGIVTDSLGNPIRDAQLELATDSPFATIYLRTSAKGEFMTDSLLLGRTYSLTVARLGYRGAELKPFVAEAGTAREVHVVLSRRQVVVVQAVRSQPLSVSSAR